MDNMTVNMYLEKCFEIYVQLGIIPTITYSGRLVQVQGYSDQINELVSSPL